MNERPNPDSILEEVLRITDLKERAAYLDRACGEDEVLRQQVESLLAAQFAAEEFMETAGAANWLPQTEQEGDWIGRYKLLELVGEGGFGRVWMAEQREPMERKVALKIIKLGMDTKEVLARFEAERQALAMMDHPNIATVLDGGTTENGRPYFVMELVRGVPITTYCDANKLPPRARIDLFGKVCEAVQHAHLKGIIHRDLKPSNILVTVQDDKPVPKVIDFGVAKALQKRLTERTLFTRMNQWVGTPEYMSPEQAGLESHDVDTRSDVYTLGVILYELLTGHTPFGARELREEGYEAILRTIREEDAPKPSTRLSSLSREELSSVADHRGESPEKLGREIRGEIDWILLKALDRDRTRRYESANQLADELRRFSDHEPISAVPPSFTYRAKKHLRKHPGHVVALGGIVFLLIVGSSLLTWWATRPGPEPFARGGDPLLATLRGHEAEVTALDFSTSRRLLASASFDNTVKLWDSETGALLETLRGHEDSVWGLAFSPGGDILASAGCDGRILLWDPTSGELLRHLEEDDYPDYRGKNATDVGTLQFTHDGRCLAVCGRHKRTIKLWDIWTGTLVSELDLHGLEARRFTVSQDGTMLAVVSSRHALVQIELATGKWAWVHPEIDKGIAALAYSPDGRVLATGTGKGELVLWDTTAGQVSSRLQGYPAEVASVAFSRDGAFLAAGGPDGIWIWDVETGRKVTTLRGHYRLTSILEFFGDGRTLASASTDHEIKVWDFQGAIAGAESARAAQRGAAQSKRASLGPPIAADEFDQELSLNWRIVNPDPNHVSLTKVPGTLTITTKQSPQGAGNLHLFENPVSLGGDFTLTTCLHAFSPDKDHQTAGLICYADGGNYVRCTSRYRNYYGGRSLVLDGRNTGEGPGGLSLPLEVEEERVWLRLTKRGNKYSGYFSVDGVKFRSIGELSWANNSPKMVGLIATHGYGAPPIDASFDYFELRKPVNADPVPTVVATGKPATIKHYWSFDDGSFQDNVGSAHGSITRGTLDPERTYPGAGPSLGEGHDGGGAVEIGTYMTPVNATNHNTVAIAGRNLNHPGLRPFSVSFWVNLASLDDAERAIGRSRGIMDFSGNRGDGTGAEPHGFQFLIRRSDNRLCYRVDGNRGGTDIYYAGDGIAEGRWVFIVGTYDSAVGLTVFINGSGTTVTRPFHVGEVSFHRQSYFGAFNLMAGGAGRPDPDSRQRFEFVGLTGSLDDVAIYDGILTEVQIDALHAGSLSPEQIGN